MTSEGIAVDSEGTAKECANFLLIGKMSEVAEFDLCSLIIGYPELCESDELLLDCRILSSFCFLRLKEILRAFIGFGGFKNLILVSAPIWFWAELTLEPRSVLTFSFESCNYFYES